ncbi:CRISPR-associated protein Csx11 [candidate division KSB1 bacterium]|nr:MAG: CRISPR-associated protein Csx11 [candidate division KSB1 bacterium]
MISTIEIRNKARESGVPETTIERDYAQNWILKNLFEIKMALKGGTGIRKIYVQGYRFSDDLDFTLLEKTGKKDIINAIENAIIKAKEDSGIEFREEIQLEENINGFTANIYFSIIKRGSVPIKIKLDITGYHKEKVLLPIENRKIIHPYSDSFEARINTYSLEEIVAEKVRALFERTRPRDLYDVWYFFRIYNINDLLDIINRKCEIKKVKIDILSLKDRTNDFKNAWNSSLIHQFNQLPDFNFVFENVIEKVKEICA